jgi:hypothetical protein
VLAVGVDLDDEVVAVADRVPVARPDRPADAGVDHVFDHRRAVAPGDLGGVVRGAVVDHDHPVDVLPGLFDHGADGGCLVVGGDHGDGAHGSTLR